MFGTIMDVLNSEQHKNQSAVLRFLWDFVCADENDLVLCLLTTGSPNDAFAAEFAEQLESCKVPLMPANLQAGFKQIGEGVRRYDSCVSTNLLLQLH